MAQGHVCSDTALAPLVQPDLMHRSGELLSGSGPCIPCLQCFSCAWLFLHQNEPDKIQSNDAPRGVEGAGEYYPMIEPEVILPAPSDEDTVAYTIVFHLCSQSSITNIFTK